MKRELPSLQGDISRTITLASAGWLLAILLTVVWGVRHEVDELMDDALRESAEVMYGLFAVRSSLPDEVLGEGPGEVLPAPPHIEHLVWQVVDARNRLLRRSHMAPSRALLPAFSPGFNDTPDGWRVYAMALPDRERVLYVAQTVAERFESRHEAALSVALIALVVSILFAWILRNRVEAAMSPLRQLTRQIKSYDPLVPVTALPEANRAEIAEVGAAIDDLGERLARRVLNEQAFAAHAAHALRTPLAGMDAQLAMAQREVGEAARPRIALARAAVERLKRVVSSLLVLFRTGTELELQPVILSDLAARLPVEPLALHVLGSGVIRADPSLLSAGLANLLDNSVRHGARNAWLSLQTEGGVQILRLRDDGPGVGDARRASLQRSLAGLDGGTQTGLGLKLAQLVARAHGGSLRLEAPDPGAHGFVVTLRLWEERDEPTRP